MSDDFKQFSKKMQDFEQMLDAFRQMSESFNGVVRDLVGQGWTDMQAREIVVAAFVAQANPFRGQPK